MRERPREKDRETERMRHLTERKDKATKRQGQRGPNVKKKKNSNQLTLIEPSLFFIVEIVIGRKHDRNDGDLQVRWTK